VTSSTWWTCACLTTAARCGHGMEEGGGLRWPLHRLHGMARHRRDPANQTGMLLRPTDATPPAPSAQVVEGCEHVFNLAADMGGMGFIQVSGRGRGGLGLRCCCAQLRYGAWLTDTPLAAA